MDVSFSATTVGGMVSLGRRDISTANCSCSTDRRPTGATEVFARFYDASGLSNTITLETKAFTSRMCVRPQAIAMAPKSSVV
jgi:hypothetical protein